MATATLTFNLAEEDDSNAHLRAIKSLDMAMALWQIMYNTKKGIKYRIESEQQKDPSFDCYDAVDMVFDRVYEILQEHNLSVDELLK
jgi:hypothetical protein